VKHLSIHESRAPTPDREEISPLNPMKDHRQCEITFPKEGKNQNEKRNPVTQITGKKARNLSKKKAKLEKLQDVPERTLQKEGLQKWNFVGISELQILALHHAKAI
jgi:hypothetical protein